MADDVWTGFLTARLSEEHFLSHKFVYVDGGKWTAEVLAGAWWYGDPPKSRSATDPIIQHAARYNPARIVREIEAKRVILGMHYPVREDYTDADGQPRSSYACIECDNGGVPDNWPCRTVRALAAIWSDHPDYPPSP